jgi:hypothetical protein
MLRPALAVLFALGAGAAHADQVRIFAVGHKTRMADVTTYQTYRDKMGALMDAAFPGRASLVQAGVDDVKSHLYPTDPLAPPQALVVFPEDTGLPAALIGTRGAAARSATTSAAAIATTFGPYSPQAAYYNTKFPPQPGIRVLVLALTDTIYRSFYETFRDLAVQYGVYGRRPRPAADFSPGRRVGGPRRLSRVDADRFGRDRGGARGRAASAPRSPAPPRSCVGSTRREARRSARIG